jgi:hypothetical protein
MTNLANKLDHILTGVYNEHRTWHNWINYEWLYRNQLNRLISFNHEPNSESADNNNKTIGLIIGPEFALKTYLKFNFSLNGLTHKHFKQNIEKSCQEIKECSTTNKNILIIESESLFTESINPNIYKVD